MVVMTPREKWTDERLDDLNKKVDKGFEEMREGFARVDGDIKELRRETKAEIKELRQEMDTRFDKVDARFGKVDETFESLQREMKEGFEGLYQLLFKSAVAIVVALCGIIGALIGISAL
jgi:predicted  nucleic acid-binding Zn-ribbon protein